MPSRPRALVAVILIGVPLVVAARSDEVVERIPATVDGRPVLLTEVRALARVRGTDESTALEALVDEHLMYREALRLPAAAPNEGERQAALLSLLRSDPALGAEFTRATLGNLVERQLAILKYIDLRFRPQVRIDDAVLAAALRAEQLPSGGASDREAEERVRTRLQRRQLDVRIEEWVRELRSLAEIRYNRP